MVCARLGSAESVAGSWALSQFGQASLPDARLKKRLIQVATSMTQSPDSSLPKSCADWADLKGAYRLLSNGRVLPDDVQASHRQQTRTESMNHDVVLCIQDTTELDFTKRTTLKGVGPIGNGGGRGVLQHTTLAATPQGEVLGILHQIWTVRVAAPENETRRERLARPKESDLWPDSVNAVGRPPTGTRYVHVCDRAGDLFEMFQACDDHGCGFLIRAQHNRNVNGSHEKLWDFMAAGPVLGRRRVAIPSQAGQSARTAELEIRACRVVLNAPQHDRRFNKPREVWAVYVTEQPSEGITPIEWLLLTSEATKTFEEADQRVTWYTHRWIIEEFHKVEKTGCRLEASRLDHGADIQRLAAIVAVIAVRLLMLRDLAQQATDTQQPESEDPGVLQRMVPWLWIVVVAQANKKRRCDPQQLTPREFWLRIAQRGGFIGRKSDGKPGWSTVWKGWSEFMHMVQGAELMAEALKRENCG